METVYFYGRTKPDPKYWPFSNFYYAPFKDSNGTVWDTTEHYFQAMKFLPDAEYKGKSLRDYIRKQKFPKFAAIEGRRRDFPLRKDWENVKDGYMYKAIYYKFTQHEDLKTLLLETGDAEIVEQSPIDFYWGCGGDNTGKNVLGKLLMKLRSELKNG